MIALQSVCTTATQPITMKSLRRYIALFFLAAYLTAAGGRLWTILSCPCVALHEHTEICAHHGHHHAAHGSCCMAAADRTEGVSVAAPCCNHHHSDDTLLYTTDDDKRDRTLRGQLLPDRLLAAVIVEPLGLRAAGSGRSLRRCIPPAPPLSGGCLALAGLRAPPVTA